jgi:hypothetical protein
LTLSGPVLEDFNLREELTMTTLSESAPEVLRHYYGILRAGIDAYDPDGELRTLLVRPAVPEGAVGLQALPLGPHRTKMGPGQMPDPIFERV